MMLLMGMKMSLTKNPTNPITTNPIAVLTATFVNSASPSNQNESKNTQKKGKKAQKFRFTEDKPLRSGLWQRLTSRTLSLANSRRGSTTESRASIRANEREKEMARRNPRNRDREPKTKGACLSSFSQS